jgi:hypothetical protein
MGNTKQHMAANSALFTVWLDDMISLAEGGNDMVQLNLK